MNDYLKPQKYQLAYQDNNLVRTALRMSLLQLRIFKLALSELNTTMTEFPTTTIPASTFMRWLSNGESYEVLHRAVSGLAYKVLDLVPANQRTTRTHKIPIMAEVEFVAGEGVIRVTFNEKAAPYLLQLKGNYTVTDIEVALRFKNPNSARLYDILHSYAGKGEEKAKFHTETISLDDLKIWLLDNAALYPIFTEFKRRVLDPIALEFAAIGYGASWVPFKTGKKTTAITFTIPRQRHKLPPSEDASTPDQLAPPEPATEEAAPLMRVNKDVPATLAKASSASDLTIKLTTRFQKLKLTEAQLHKVMKHVDHDPAKATKILKATYPLLRDYETGNKTFDNIAASAVNLLKTELPGLYADKEF